MTRPEIFEIMTGDEVDSLVPVREQESKSFETRGDVGREAEIGKLLNQLMFHVKHRSDSDLFPAPLVRWAARAARAAGVMPGIRAAAPSEIGRILSNFPINSAERPPIRR